MNQTKDKKFNYWTYLKNYKFKFLIFILLYLVTSAIDIFSTIYFARVIELITLSQYNEGFKLLILIGVCLVVQRFIYLFNGLRWGFHPQTPDKGFHPLTLLRFAQF